MDRSDDRTLIANCIAGDRYAWGLLIERYERLIFSIPLRYGMSESQAADIFQDVCLIMLNKLEQLHNEERLAAWLATVTRRECWKTMQRRDAAGYDDPERLLNGQVAPTDDPGDVMAEWESWEAVRRGLDEIEERCRRLLHLLYFESPQPSYTEIAADLGLPTGSIGPTRARCLKKLQRAIVGRRAGVRST